MNDDLGDVGDFERPTLDEAIIEAIASLVIDESPASTDRIAEDIDNLIEAIGSERMRVLRDYLARGDVADAVCDDPSFRERVARRVEEFREALNSIDYDDTGDL